MLHRHEDVCVHIPIASIIEFCDPMKSDIWGVGRLIEPSEIESAIASGEFETRHLEPHLRDRPYHVQRIAYFFVLDFMEPIDLDVGTGQEDPPPWWMVLDGNHRLFAAQLRRDRDIPCLIQGDLDYAAELFSINIA